MVQHLMAL